MTLIKKNKRKEQTEASLIKKELESLEGYVNELFTFLPLPFCIANSSGVIIYINKTFEDLTGYSFGDLIKKDIGVLFLDKEEINTLKKEVLKKKIIREREIIILSRKKEKIVVNFYFQLREDKYGNPMGYFLVFSDIRKLKKFQEKLEEIVEERTQRLKNIITNLIDGLLVFDEKNILTLINPQAEKYLNLKSEKIVKKSISDLSIIPFFKSLLNFLGKKILKEELKIKDLVLEITTIPIKKKERRETVVIIHDITREKTVERLKTEFVSIAAHQLRTPLSAVKWSLSLLKEGKIEEAQKKEYLEKTYRTNERMIALINDLLNITRIEEGRYLYPSEIKDIVSIVKSIIKPFQEEAKKKNIKFKFSFSPKRIPKIKTEEEKIILAIQNLIDNAICYTKSGGEVNVSINYDKDRREIIFMVKDTGVGIPKTQLKRVFTRFFRGENVIRVETEGTGLGLFIAKNIIESHGGKIWFESKENKGSTFYFSLPAAEE